MRLSLDVVNVDARIVSILVLKANYLAFYWSYRAVGVVENTYVFDVWYLTDALR